MPNTYLPWPWAGELQNWGGWVFRGVLPCMNPDIPSVGLAGGVTVMMNSLENFEIVATAVPYLSHAHNYWIGGVGRVKMNLFDAIPLDLLQIFLGGGLQVVLCPGLCQW